MEIDYDDFFRGRELMKITGIRNRAALCNMTIIFKREELEKDPSLLEKNYNKFFAVRELFGNKLRYLRRPNEKIIQIQKEQRELAQDVNLIDNSKSTLDILGINSLGPLHSGREKIIAFVNKRNGKVRILLLNPISVSFQLREEKEELFNNLIVGRLQSEYNASIAICEDILNFTDFSDNIKIKVHKQNPIMALVISDGDLDAGCINCNIYPEEKNVRGLMGKHNLHITKDIFFDQFVEYQNYFNELWNNSEEIEEIISFVSKKK